MALSHWVPCFEELLFPVNLPISFSTSNPEEFGVGKFFRLFFHLVPDEIHPVALLIVVVLFFYCVFLRCCCYEETLFEVL